jgi:hypothetical protein
MEWDLFEKGASFHTTQFSVELLPELPDFRWKTHATWMNIELSIDVGLPGNKRLVALPFKVWEQ